MADAGELVMVEVGANLLRDAYARGRGTFTSLPPRRALELTDYNAAHWYRRKARKPSAKSPSTGPSSPSTSVRVKSSTLFS